MALDKIIEVLSANFLDKRINHDGENEKALRVIANAYKVIGEEAHSFEKII